MTKLLLIKTSESEKIKSLLDQNNTDYEIIYKGISRDLTEEKLKKIVKQQEEKRRIELARSHLTEIGNSWTFRKEIEATEKAAEIEGIEAYWKLQDKLSRELANHLINYKDIDNATAFVLRLADILNGIDAYKHEKSKYC